MEQVERLLLLGDKVYALTSTNYLFCLNRDSGDLVFGMPLATEGFPVLDPQLYKIQLLVVAGNRLIQIEHLDRRDNDTEKFSYLSYARPCETGGIFTRRE